MTRTLAGVAGAVASSLALAVAAAPAVAGRDPTARVVFARADSLWLTDAAGKTAPVAIATLPIPATEVRTIRADAAGTRLLVDVGGRWYWMPVPERGATATLTPLPCATGPARLAGDGKAVLCADARGQAWLMRLTDGRGTPRAVPAATASFTVHDGVRELVWADAPGGPVLASPVAHRQARTVAPAAPLRGLLAAPDGSRAVGVYRAPSVGLPAAPGERDQLMGFALDGIGALRRLIRDGVVLDWSWDSQWLLIQDHAAACVARAVGGEYKCWKGYTAVSVAPDGAFALVAGPRDGAPTTAEPAGDDGGEGGEGEGTDDDEGADVGDDATALPRGPLSLYRAKLAGAYTEAPVMIVKQLDGAAVWLP